jgi:hypothetical protein
MKLLSFTKSDKPGKKYTAVVQHASGTKTIHFGDSNMKDYTLFSPEEREKHRKAYLSRHASREDWKDPLTAGFWSRHILWGATPSVSKNLLLVKRMYGL